MLLSCSHLTVRFESRGRRTTAIEGLSMEVRAGEFVGLIGPSGCGKTTLLRTMAGLLAPAEGAVLNTAGVAGERLMVFQEDSLFPWMTVLENAAFGLEMKGVERAGREGRARAMLARLGLGGREGDYPHQLSAGMKQRVAVIRAFLSEPGLLLMDEPFGALDGPTRRVLQDELLEMWRRSRRAVVFVTHDVDEAIYLSDRVVVLSASPGRVVGEVAVGLEREQGRAALLSEEYLRIKREVCGMLEGEWMARSAAGEGHAA